MSTRLRWSPPFSARRTWRGQRTLSDLPRRTAAVYVGLAFLRVRMVVAESADVPGAAGPPRRWDCACEYGVGSQPLSGALARTGFRTKSAGRRNGLYLWPDHRLGHSRD